MDRRQPTAIRKLGIASNIKALWRIAVDHIESSLNSEAAWRTYMEVLEPADDERYRFQRFNVELDDGPPKLDDVDSMNELEEHARQQWSGKQRIHQVAYHLIATCFFFEKTRVEPLGDGSFECTGSVVIPFQIGYLSHDADVWQNHLSGSIQCRFTPGTSNIRYLGEFLRDRQYYQHNLYFVVRERYRELEARQVLMGQTVIEEMIRNGRFSMGQVKFNISGQLSITEILLSIGRSADFPISGFPRTLQQEDAPRSKSLLPLLD